jgi:hypothetical protein
MLVELLTITFKLSFVLLMMVELLTITFKLSFVLLMISDGQQFHQHQQNKRKFKQ